MAEHIFPMREQPKCRECGVPLVVVLNVTNTGYTITSRHQHKPECSELRCPHGILWGDDCEKCEALRDEYVESD